MRLDYFRYYPAVALQLLAFVALSEDCFRLQRLSTAGLRRLGE